MEEEDELEKPQTMKGEATPAGWRITYTTRPTGVVDYHWWSPEKKEFWTWPAAKTYLGME